ncbi:hypothetical protein GF351_02250 [Candidatus Woesearchaeota archaeon]|nr:hypothetical protein [Candidatus Woesearchaeota archaeon]
MNAAGKRGKQEMFTWYSARVFCMIMLFSGILSVVLYAAARPHGSFMAALGLVVVGISAPVAFFSAVAVFLLGIRHIRVYREHGKTFAMFSIAASVLVFAVITGLAVLEFSV